jgi:hypothetical protein
MKHGFNPQTDQYYLTCDKDTAEYIQKEFPLIRNVRCLVVPKPTSVYDGMKLKYVLPFLVNLPAEVILYVDVDVFQIRKMVSLDLPEDSLMIYAEGKAEDSNYRGDLEFQATHGYSAGFFAYRWGKGLRECFTQILRDLETIPERYYTLDQPYFNKYAQGTKMCWLNPSRVSGNGHGNLQDAVFVNCCGEPGDGRFHWNKMLQLYLSLV